MVVLLGALFLATPPISTITGTFPASPANIQLPVGNIVKDSKETLSKYEIVFSTASAILKKLCYKSKKNKLHQAFRELGRVVRTIFLLDYISDVDLRRKIQAATCKSEKFNDFIDWIAFGKNGIIEQNNPNIQKKIIAFGRMTANAVMFHTVATQTNALNQLTNEMIEYNNDSLSILSAFFRENINRYGVFELSMSKTPIPLEFNIQSKKQT